MALPGAGRDKPKLGRVLPLLLLLAAAGVGVGFWWTRPAVRLPDRLEELGVNGVRLGATRAEVEVVRGQPTGPDRYGDLDVLFRPEGEAWSLKGTELTAHGQVLLRVGERASRVWALYGNRGYRTEAADRGQYAIGLQGSPIVVLVTLRSDRVAGVLAVEQDDRLRGLDGLD